MEQQQTYRKGGDHNDANTRTAVLAAVNPAWGRYDIRRSPAENIAPPAALLTVRYQPLTPVVTTAALRCGKYSRAMPLAAPGDSITYTVVVEKNLDSSCSTLDYVYVCT
jgi:hypothetical protein